MESHSKLNYYQDSRSGEIDGLFFHVILDITKACNFIMCGLHGKFSIYEYLW